MKLNSYYLMNVFKSYPTLRKMKLEVFNYSLGMKFTMGNTIWKFNQGYIYILLFRAIPAAYGSSQASG